MRRDYCKQLMDIFNFYYILQYTKTVIIATNLSEPYFKLRLFTSIHLVTSFKNKNANELKNMNFHIHTLN